MHKEKLSMTPFSTYEPQQSERARYQRETFRAWTRRRERDRVRAGSMLAKIGVCVGLLTLVILVQMFLLKQEGAVNAVETVAGEASEESSEEEDILGKLRFVSAGGVKSVFAESQRWSLPVQGGEQTLLRDDTLLCMGTKAEETVCVCAAGEVRAVSQDETLGAYVRVNHGNDLESAYYHLEQVQVEVGQPLQAGDILGKTGADGLLYVGLTNGGVPQNPADFLNVSKNTDAAAEETE